MRVVATSRPSSKRVAQACEKTPPLACMQFGHQSQTRQSPGPAVSHQVGSTSRELHSPQRLRSRSASMRCTWSYRQPRANTRYYIRP